MENLKQWEISLIILGLLDRIKYLKEINYSGEEIKDCEEIIYKLKNLL